MDEAKYSLMNEIVQCIGEATELDSDDSEKEEILIGLVNLCERATYLPNKTRKRKWIKSWRNAKKERGSFAFLTNELLLDDESSYKNYIRMTKLQFQTLLDLIQHDIERSNTVMRESIKASEKLALTLRFLATGETYQSLDYQTRISKASICNIIPEVTEIIWKKLKPMYVKFPSSHSQWESIAKEFALKWQFPNCIGAIDGKHINFRSRRSDGAFYHNYKGTNSIILLALVDANCRFIYIDIGCNGRNNDAGVFLQSKLRNILQEGKEIPPNAVVGNGRCLPYVVIGDDAFPMQTHLMKPYPYQTNSPEKQIFNARIARARHVVEHAFGILANRFRVFLTHMDLKVETVEKITFACCALHNFLMQTDDSYISSTQHALDHRREGEKPYNPRKGEAEAIRQQFMLYFSNEGKLDWM